MQTRDDSLTISIDAVDAALRHHLPGRVPQRIEDRGVWIRRIFRVELDGGDVVYLKADLQYPASEKEAFICRLLQEHGLPAPVVLALDTSGTLLPVPFLIQEHTGGERLGEVLAKSGRSHAPAIYAALGHFYQRLHAIRHDHAGWIEGDGEVLLFSPHEHQFREVIERIGAEAVSRGLLTSRSHRRLRSLWRDHLPWLKEHPPALIGGALHWTVCLARNGGWRVTRLMDLHDVLFWDPAWDLTGIKFPVFLPPPAPADWDAFLSAYGSVPDERRLQLYRLMQHLDAAMGNYMAPPAPENRRWQAHVWATFAEMLTKTERVCPRTP